MLMKMEFENIVIESVLTNDKREFVLITEKCSEDCVEMNLEEAKFLRDSLDKIINI